MSESVTDVKKESSKLDPSKFLSEIIGNSVTVKLHNGVEYLGKLQSIDGYMNIVLDETKEVINGNIGRAYGDVFLRGNNGKCFQYLRLPS
ncbi:Piso0_004969 [Millerozyma farinosa CBS 7064]|uniref:Piso0_004969 protein n=1 Tax=Pichia sorbitophila (strain ATCC MYA-4447 / BCRC 22081 / CBS 7064 / NBRC 10061 / NRRL Y-12695) TaxID=559304 RepID=G8Y3W0_PICSO|nr:Piso0_004969 [Millerozyma farinosa CBS 7064]